MTFKKIKDHDNLVKNTINNSIINIDMQEYENYIETYRQAKSKLEESKKINQLEKDLDKISNEISEIKELLKRLI